MTGRELACLYASHFDGAPETYYDCVDSNEQEAWNGLASQLTRARADGEHEAASSAVHWVANEITDAWERREARRCPSTT